MKSSKMTGDFTSGCGLSRDGKDMSAAGRMADRQKILFYSEIPQ